MNVQLSPEARQTKLMGELYRGIVVKNESFLEDEKFVVLPSGETTSDMDPNWKKTVLEMAYDANHNGRVGSHELAEGNILLELFIRNRIRTEIVPDGKTHFLNGLPSEDEFRTTFQRYLDWRMMCRVCHMEVPLSYIENGIIEYMMEKGLDAEGRYVLETSAGGERIRIEFTPERYEDGRLKTTSTLALTDSRDLSYVDSGEYGIVPTTPHYLDAHLDFLTVGLVEKGGTEEVKGLERSSEEMLFDWYLREAYKTIPKRYQLTSAEVAMLEQKK
jgi:hypothetical protein